MSRVVRHDIGPYHREYKGHSWYWYRREMFLEGHAIIVLVLEPHGINGLLDDGVLIFVERIPTRIVFL